MQEKILFDEQGLHPGTPFEKGQWKEIASHNELEIKGFFGDYRFLSNFWPAKVFLDEEEYSCVENAYQAAKYPKETRGYLQVCSAKEAIIFSREHPLDEFSVNVWNDKKIHVMEQLLLQKFDLTLNVDLYQQLQETGHRYLEETNYWGDIFWGVTKSSRDDEGKGENNLGRLLMKIRGMKSIF